MKMQLAIYWDIFVYCLLQRVIATALHHVVKLLALLERLPLTPSQVREGLSAASVGI